MLSAKGLKWRATGVLNFLKHGNNAPLRCEGIYIDPNKIDMVIDPNVFHSRDSGRVVGGDWDLRKSSISSFPKFIICYERFVNGKSWQEAGAYDLMINNQKENGDHPDGCRSLEDIEERYKQIDELYKNIKKNNLLSRREINPSNFRESGGVYVHVDRNGDIIFGRSGCHRIAIAIILQLQAIPVQVGVVHENALSYWRSFYKKV